MAITVEKHKPSSAVLKEMNASSNETFYKAFLGNFTNDKNAPRTIPHWMLPRLVKDGDFELAGAYANSIASARISQRGAALEWSLVFAIEKTQEDIRGTKSGPNMPFNYAAVFSELDKREDIPKMFDRFEQLKNIILSALERLDGYTVKTGWIKEEIASHQLSPTQ